MPNWATTEYIITGDPNSIKTIKKAIEECQNRVTENKLKYKQVKDRFPLPEHASKQEQEDVIEKIREATKHLDMVFDIWLVHILNKLGVSDATINKADGNFRGYIYEMNFEENDKDDTLMMRCETAWTETDGFRHMLSSIFPDLDILYTTEECGMEVYVTNNPEWEDRYVIYSEMEGTEYFDGNDSAREYLNDLMGTSYDDIEEALEGVNTYNKNNQDNQISVNQFTMTED